MNNLVKVSNATKIGNETVSGESLIVSLSRTKYSLVDGSNVSIVYDANEMNPSSNEIEISGTWEYNPTTYIGPILIQIQEVTEIDTIRFSSPSTCGFSSDNIILIRDNHLGGSVITIAAVSSSGLQSIQVYSNKTVDDIWSRYQDQSISFSEGAPKVWNYSSEAATLDRASVDGSLSKIEMQASDSGFDSKFLLQFYSDYINMKKSNFLDSQRSRIRLSSSDFVIFVEDDLPGTFTYISLDSSLGFVFQTETGKKFSIKLDGSIETNQIQSGAPAGSATKKLPLYNELGVLQGYIPLFN